MFSSDSLGSPVGSGQPCINPVADLSQDNGDEDLVPESKIRSFTRQQTLGRMVQTHGLMGAISRQNYIICAMVGVLIVFSVTSFTISCLANEMTKDTTTKDGALVEKNSGQMMRTLPAFDKMPRDSGSPQLSTNVFLAIEEATVTTDSVIMKVKLTDKMVLPCPSLGRDDAWSMYCQNHFVYLGYSNSPFTLFATQVSEGGVAKPIKFGIVDDEAFLAAVTGKNRMKFQTEVSANGAPRHLLSHNTASATVTSASHCSYRMGQQRLIFSIQEHEDAEHSPGSDPEHLYHLPVSEHWIYRPDSYADLRTTLNDIRNNVHMFDTLSDLEAYDPGNPGDYGITDDYCLVCANEFELLDPQIVDNYRPHPSGEGFVNVSMVLPVWVRPIHDSDPNVKTWFNSCRCAQDGWVLSIHDEEQVTVNVGWVQSWEYRQQAPSLAGRLQCTASEDVAEEISWSHWVGHSQQLAATASDATKGGKGFDLADYASWDGADDTCVFYGNSCASDGDCCGVMMCDAESGSCVAPFHSSDRVFGYAYMGEGVCSDGLLNSLTVSESSECAQACDENNDCLAWSYYGDSTITCEIYGSGCYSDLKREFVFEGCHIYGAQHARAQYVTPRENICPQFVLSDMITHEQSQIPIQDEHGCVHPNNQFVEDTKHTLENLDGEVVVPDDLNPYTFHTRAVGVFEPEHWGVGWECNTLDQESHDGASSYRKLCIPAGHECWDETTSDLQGNDLSFGKCCGGMQCLLTSEGERRCGFSDYITEGEGLCASPAEAYTNSAVMMYYTGASNADFTTLDAESGEVNIATCKQSCDEDATCKAFSFTSYMQSVSPQKSTDQNGNIYRWSDNLGCLGCDKCNLYHHLPGSIAGEDGEQHQVDCRMHLEQLQLAQAGPWSTVFNHHPGLYHSYATFKKPPMVVDATVVYNCMGDGEACSLVGDASMNCCSGSCQSSGVGDLPGYTCSASTVASGAHK
mmetsp:Transcript_29589/g.35946  ORF Transcript_29589/g.35946 Transcript_29589/m.35946 type:complete len:969 (+) Transcript_29589:97-3003(+)